MSQEFVLSEGTAARRRFYLHLVDATDNFTPETGEAAGQPQVSKNGAAFGNTTATLTHVGNGTYYVELTASELDTLGKIVVRYKSANTAEFADVGVVLAVNIYDAVRAGLTALPNAAAEAAGGLFTRGTGAGQINQDANGRIDANVAALANDVISASKVAADVSAEIADAVWDEAIAGHLAAGSTGEALDNAGAAGTPPTAAEIADAVWDEDWFSHAVAGSFGIIASEALLGYINGTMWDVDLTAHLVANSASEYVLNIASQGGDTNTLVNAYLDAPVSGAISAAQAAETAATTAAANAGNALASAGSVMLTSVTTAGSTTTRLNDTVGLAGYATDELVGRRLKVIGGANVNAMRYIVASGDGYIEVLPPLMEAPLVAHAYQIFLSPPVAEVVHSLDLDRVESYAPLHSLCSGLLKLVSKTSLEATLLRIYMTDGVTTFATQPRTTDATLVGTSVLGAAE